MPFEMESYEYEYVYVPAKSHAFEQISTAPGTRGDGVGGGFDGGIEGGAIETETLTCSCLLKMPFCRRQSSYPLASWSRVTVTLKLSSRKPPKPFGKGVAHKCPVGTKKTKSFFFTTCSPANASSCGTRW